MSLAPAAGRVVTAAISETRAKTRDVNDGVLTSLAEVRFIDIVNLYHLLCLLTSSTSSTPFTSFTSYTSSSSSASLTSSTCSTFFNFNQVCFMRDKALVSPFVLHRQQAEEAFR